jgi:integral membrane protein
MVQETWTSRYLVATLILAVKVRWPVWTTIGMLLAGTIPLLGVILERFRTKQVNEKFDL